MNWSDASATCRLEWRRSRCLPPALCVLAFAAIAALWLSDLPRFACGFGSACAIAYAGWLLLRELRRPDCVLSWLGGDSPWQLECNGRTESLRHVRATIRGGMVALALAGADNTPRRYLWWPDTIDGRGRRALRLALRVETVVTPVQPTLP